MTDPAARGYAHPEVLVSTEWVAEHQEDPSMRLVESNEDPLVYPSGHLAGAVEIDWARDLNDSLRRDYLDRAGFEQLMRSHGIGNDDDRRPLWRQEQLVGVLCLLDLPALRASPGENHGRRQREVGASGAGR